MVNVIRAIMLACILQMVVGAIFTTYLFNHASAIAEQYTDTALRLQYNQLQVERRDEREDMRAWVDRRINLKIDKAMRELKQ